MNKVLIIIDMQNDFFMKERLFNNRASLSKNINTLVSQARRQKIPIIWIKQVFKSDLSDAPKWVREHKEKYVIENTEGSKILPELDKRPEDLEIIKKRYSAFYNTNLEKILDKLSIDTLIVCGINTHACVRMAVVDAYQRDYNVIVAEDCVDSWDKKHHEITLKYFEPKIARVINNLKL